MTSLNPAIAIRESASFHCRWNTATTTLATVCVVTLTFSLSRNLFAPLWLDQAYFRYIVEGAMSGHLLYGNVWNQDGPCILAVHWLARVLFGPADIGLRVFDACWQVVTLGALVAMGARDGRRWATGWLAATLYAMAYYGTGYANTADRAGFIVLPMLLMAHAFLTATRYPLAGTTRRRACFLAGLLGLIVFQFKSPFGATFGLLWLWCLFDAWRNRRRGLICLSGVAWMTAGFLAGATIMVVILTQLGVWSTYWPLLLRIDAPPGYVTGHWQLMELLPKLLCGGGLVAALLAWSIFLQPRPQAGTASSSFRIADGFRSLAVGTFIFGLLITVIYWGSWRSVLLRVMGGLIPALGAVLVCVWRGRSESWRIMMLLTAGSAFALVIQGGFNMYSFIPMLACASYLSSHETLHRLQQFHTTSESARVWTAVCLACTAHLAFAHWGQKMMQYSTRPDVLAGQSIHDHYARVTADRTNQMPAYATVRRVASRIQQLTTPDQSIASLFGDPRIYLAAGRPTGCKWIYIHPCYSHFWPEMMQAIQTRRPAVLLGRVPAGLRNTVDSAAVEAAIFDEAEAFYGPPARSLRSMYHASEVIDDVCLFEPAR